MLSLWRALRGRPVSGEDAGDGAAVAAAVFRDALRGEERRGALVPAPESALSGQLSEDVASAAAALAALRPSQRAALAALPADALFAALRAARAGAAAGAGAGVVAAGAAAGAGAIGERLEGSAEERAAEDATLGVWHAARAAAHEARDLRDTAARAEVARAVLAARLVDRTRRNRLLHLPLPGDGQPPQPSAPVALRGSAEARRALLAGHEAVPALAFELGAGDPQRLLALRRRAAEEAARRGTQTLFLAVGVAVWEGGGPAPALLVPAVISAARVGGKRGAKGAAAVARARAQPSLNLALVQVLRERGAVLPSDIRLLGDDGDVLADDALRAIAAAAEGALPGFRLDAEFLAVGTFSMERSSMLIDVLDCPLDVWRRSDLVASTYDEQARARMRSRRQGVDAAQSQTATGDPLRALRAGLSELSAQSAAAALNKQPPDAQFFVADADSSQMAAVKAVLEGEHTVLLGPPGSGKSQTIANMVAHLAAKGRPVLLVAEKRAALNAVRGRLEQVGLGHLVLDLHGVRAGAAGSEAALAQLAAARDAAAGAAVPAAAAAGVRQVHAAWNARRAEIEAHVAALHRQVHAPLGLTAAQLAERVRALRAWASTVRWHGATLSAVAGNAPRVRELLALLSQGHLHPVFLRRSRSAWNGAVLHEDLGDEAAETLLERARRGLEDLAADGARLAAVGGLVAPVSAADARELLELLHEVNELCAKHGESAFEEDLEECLAEGERATARWPRFGRPSSGVRRARQLLAARRAWTARRAPGTAGTLPRAVSNGTDRESVRASLNRAEGLFEATGTLLRRVLPRGFPHIESLPIAEARRELDLLSADARALLDVQRVCRAERELRELGCAPVAEEIRARGAEPAAEGEWVHVFDFSLAQSCWEEVLEREPLLKSFRAATHARACADFANLDESRVRLAADRVRWAHADNLRTVTARYASMATIVGGALAAVDSSRAGAGAGVSGGAVATPAKSSASLRALMKDASPVLTALCPVWMASPLAISELIGAERRYFDVLIADEASQLLPQHAIPSMLRARQLVVAGDTKQLPPTTFFSGAGASASDSFSGAPGGEQGGGIDGAGAAVKVRAAESLLDMMAGFLQVRKLRWHYRSLHEQLIAFSAAHFYGGELVTFPSGPRLSDGAALELLRANSVDEEAAMAADAVLALLAQCAGGDEASILVITLGVEHATRIERALASRAAGTPDAMRRALRRRVAVRPLESAQGDECDFCVLSTGYARGSSAFGPLAMAGGERRLNVAITRAKRSMTVVTCLDSAALDASRFAHKGVSLLAKYLDFCAGESAGESTAGGDFVGGTAHAARHTATVARSPGAASSGSASAALAAAPPPLPLRDDIAAALHARGVRATAGFGRSELGQVQVAAGGSERGGYALAIETDCGAYEQLPTSVERARLREARLRALGWRVTRVWMLEWVRNREGEIARLVREAAEATAAAADERTRASRGSNSGAAAVIGGAGSADDGEEDDSLGSSDDDEQMAAEVKTPKSNEGGSRRKRGAVKQAGGGRRKRGSAAQAAAAAAAAEATQSRLLRASGYPVEAHNVHTADGYVLRAFRIAHGRWGTPGEAATATPPARPRPVVVLQHCLLGSSLVYLCEGCAREHGANARPEAAQRADAMDASPGMAVSGADASRTLPGVLADAGFEVWLGNARGNVFSWRHERLAISSAAYWAFSFDELARYDTPALAQHAAQIAGVQRVAWVGHSQGGGQALAAAAAPWDVWRDEAPAAHIGAVVGLAPATYLEGVSSRAAELLAHITTGLQLERVLDAAGIHQLLPDASALQELSSALCRSDAALCDGAMAFFTGHSSLLDSKRLGLCLQHTPAGTSVKNIIRYARAVGREGFRLMDLGCDDTTGGADGRGGVPIPRKAAGAETMNARRCANAAAYGPHWRARPPPYNLSAVSVPVAVFSGGADPLVSATDVARLLAALPPEAAAGHTVLPDFAHLDFVWAASARGELFGAVADQLWELNDGGVGWKKAE